MNLSKKISLIILLILAHLILFVLILEFVKQMPFVFIYGELSLFLIFIFRKLKFSNACKVIIFNIGIVTLAACILELYFANSLERSQGVNQGSYARSGFFVSDRLLGYSLKKNIRVSSKLIKNKRVVYDVIYTSNNKGLRVNLEDTVWIHHNSDFRNIIFFGCSFVFGEGLNDTETLPFVFEKNSDGKNKVYNFGISGYGSQQMLRILDSDRLDSVVTDSLPLVFLYEMFSQHIGRAGFHYPYILWDSSGPRYRLDSSGKLTSVAYINRTYAFFLKVIVKSSLVKKILFICAAGRRTNDDMRLFVEIIKQSKEIVENKYKGKFFVIYWDGTDSNKDDREIIERLTKEDISVIVTSEIFRNCPYSKEAFTIQDDGHPTALANRIIAEFLSLNLIYN